jgi:hypothetical protein
MRPVLHQNGLSGAKAEVFWLMRLSLLGVKGGYAVATFSMSRLNIS